MLSKRLSELRKGDIDQLIEEEVSEGANVEFKKSLPTKGNGMDPWIEGKGKIGDKARNELIEEVIAFANKYGGHLILGIDETKEKPPRASEVVPLPKCIELADRLRLQCRDCIEPQVPQIEVVGIPTELDGSGVVVFRVPQSRMAPHRHSITKECYTRQADRSERMSMREIQDLTLQVDRGIAAIENRFSEQETSFKRKIEAWQEENRSFLTDGPNPGQMLALRMTLLPMTPITVPRIHRNIEAKPIFVSFNGTIDGDAQKPVQIRCPITTVSNIWRPTLRGSSRELGTADFKLTQEVYSDGLIQHLAVISYTSREQYVLYPEWVFCLFANALCSVESYRRAASATTVEYGLEIEIMIHDQAVPVPPYQGYRQGRYLGNFPVGEMIFPKYSIREPQQYQEITHLFVEDFWNAAGRDSSEVINIDYYSRFPELENPG